MSWADLLAICIGLLAVIYSRSQAKAARLQAWASQPSQFSLEIDGAMTDKCRLLLRYESGPTIDVVSCLGQTPWPGNQPVEISKVGLLGSKMSPGIAWEIPCVHRRTGPGPLDWEAGEVELMLLCMRKGHSHVQLVKCPLRGIPGMY